MSEKTPVAALLDRISAHDAEGAAIEAEMATLGLDAKKLKEIRKAAEKAAAAQKTLDALVGEGIVSPGVE